MDEPIINTKASSHEGLNRRSGRRNSDTGHTVVYNGLVCSTDETLNKEQAAVLEQMTIETEDREVLEPLVKSALENEKKMVALGLERTRQRLAHFEREYGMSSEEFEKQLNSLAVAETVEFSEWRMEIGMLRLLERQYKALEHARVD
jgi:hypothetical protein